MSGSPLTAPSAAHPSRTTVEVFASRETWNRTGTRSASAATWVITPTIRSSWARVSRVVATTSRVSGSSVPNPSSRKIESSRAPPAADRLDICDDSASARASDAWKVSPPDRVRTDRLGVGVGVVDDVELAVGVGEVELAAGQARQVAGRELHQAVHRGGDQPARELVRAEQVRQHLGHGLLLARGVPPGRRSAAWARRSAMRSGGRAGPLQRRRRPRGTRPPGRRPAPGRRRRRPGPRAAGRSGH